MKNLISLNEAKQLGSGMKRTLNMKNMIKCPNTSNVSRSVTSLIMT